MSGASAMAEEKVYTAIEVADILRVKPRTVYKMIAQGKIEYFMVGDEYRITQRALREYMGTQKKPREESE
jgi:excisionase family DNA binding protein